MLGCLLCTTTFLFSVNCANTASLPINSTIRMSLIFRQGSRLSLGLIRQYHLSPLAQKRIIELVPALGESITEGSISRWSKNEGDSVVPDDVVVVVETDKVTVDIKANHKGVITKHLVKDTVR